MNSIFTNSLALAKPLKIGTFTLRSNVLLAPMAGITDSVFRNICAQKGVAATVAEMLTSDISLWNRSKSSTRLIKPTDPETTHCSNCGY